VLNSDPFGLRAVRTEKNFGAVGDFATLAAVLPQCFIHAKYRYKGENWLL
jgi:hypothetical protein